MEPTTAEVFGSLSRSGRNMTIDVIFTTKEGLNKGSANGCPALRLAQPMTVLD